MAERINDGGRAFPGDFVWMPGMSLRDYFAAHVQADDRLVKAVRAMDDVALAVFALHPTVEDNDWIAQTGPLDPTDWESLSEVEKVTKRLMLEAKAIARVRFMQADAMIAAREHAGGAR